MLEPGSIVRFRNRDWVLLPSDREEVARLRPLTGTSDDVIAVHRQLSNLLGVTFPTELISPSQFPSPSADFVADARSLYLLWQAARLLLREGAAPFRSLGRVSVRPRTYQFVPLLMALRLDPVRLLIADDVGVGKTIEAGLILRELWERGEVRRLAVLCPPYLCDQWQKELVEKFHLDPVVINSATIGQLERRTPPGRTVYEHHPVQVISIDFVKYSRNKHAFLLHPPELLVVDEAHGVTPGRGSDRHLRYELVRELASNPRRHLILLTATPHSGIAEAFQKLLGLLDPEFERWEFTQLREPERAVLTRHFVQPTRRDIEHTWEAAACFPKREAADETYELSGPYRELFERTYAFCSEIVRTGERLEKRYPRVRYWGALALLRCVMSSPAAALAALAKRDGPPGPAPASDEAPEFRSSVFESAEDRADDESPTPAVGVAEDIFAGEDRRTLRELTRPAEQLLGASEDTKLKRATEVVQRLVQDGFHPILWCRYIATAAYVAQHLRERFGQDVQVVCVTGRMGDEERQAKIAEIEADRPRVLVAADCLSEGVNLQEKFRTVVRLAYMSGCAPCGTRAGSGFRGRRSRGGSRS